MYIMTVIIIPQSKVTVFLIVNCTFLSINRKMTQRVPNYEQKKQL